MADFSLRDKVAVVTGAGGVGGIGEAYAIGLAQAGAAVVVADIRAEGAEEVADRLASEGHRVLPVGMDVTDRQSVDAMVSAAVAEFGGIDVLVNNAALMAEIPAAPLIEYPMDWWERVLRVNLTGVLVCCQSVVPAMIQRGAGRIVNQSSGGAFERLGSPYGISKLGVVGLTVGLARELGQYKITVNAIAPGAVESEAGRRIAPPDGRFRAYLREICPIRESAPPEDLLGALLLLASPAGEWITGQTLHVDGGWISRV